MRGIESFASLEGGLLLRLSNQCRVNDVLSLSFEVDNVLGMIDFLTDLAAESSRWTTERCRT